MEKIKEDSKKEDADHYGLISEFFYFTFLASSLIGGEFKSKNLEKITQLLKELALSLPSAAFGHVLKTKHKSDFIGFLVAGLIYHGLPRKSAIEHISEWSKENGIQQAGITKVRDSHAEYKKNEYKNNWIESCYQKIEEIKEGNKPPLGEGVTRRWNPNNVKVHLALSFFEKGDKFTFNHPNAKRSLNKFKDFLVEVNKLNSIYFESLKRAG